MKHAHMSMTNFTHFQINCILLSAIDTQTVTKNKFNTLELFALARLSRHIGDALPFQSNSSDGYQATPRNPTKIIKRCRTFVKLRFVLIVLA